MAIDLALSGPSSFRWSSGGLLNWGDYLVGYTDSRFAIIRYSFTIDTPLTKLSLKFTDAPNGNIFSHYGGKDYRGDAKGSDFGFYISSKDHTISEGFTKHSLGLPGMTNELRSDLKFAPGGHKEIIGELDLSKKPLPSGTYYLYIHNFTKTYGCMQWSARITDATYTPPASECTYESYTAPTAPTVFKFSYSNDNKQLLQSTGFTVEWNGAKDGTNNRITGYELFLDGTPIGEKGANANDNGTYSYSYEFEKEKDYQGKKIKVSILAKGTQNAALYSEEKTIEGRVNTRPSAPSVSKNYSGDGVYISGNIVLSLDSQDLEDSQEELTYWRKVGDDWQPLQGYEFSATISKKTTYVFKAKDTAGEFGPETFFTVYRYPQLVITKNKEASIEYKGRTDIIGYTANQACKVSATNSLNVPDISIPNFIKGENTINCVEKFELGNKVTFTFYPLDQNGIPLNLSSEKFPSSEITTPSLPSSEDIFVFDQYDKDACVLDAGATSCKHFYKEIRIKIPKFDSRINTWDAYVLFGKESLLGSKIYNNDNSSSYFYIQAKFDAAEDVISKELSIKLGSKYTISLGNFNRIINFPFKNLVSNNNESIVYDNLFLKVSFAYDETELRNSYGIIENPSWEMKVSYGPEGKQLTIKAPSPLFSTIGNNGYIEWEKFATEVNFSELGIDVSSYKGTKDFKISVGITNAYGDTYWQSCKHTYNFNKIPELTYFKFKFQDDNGELKSPDKGYNFVEGMTIRATYKIKKWQAETMAFEIQTNKGKTTLFPFSDMSNNSLSGAESNEISIDFKIPKITKTETWNLCLYNRKVSRSVGTAYNTLPVNDKTVSLTGFDYSHNDNKTGTYTLKSFALSPAAEGKLAYSLIFAGNEKPYPIGNNNTVIIPDDANPLANNNDSVIGSLLIIETITNSGYTLTKEWHSNTVVIYSIVPTISYRKNRVGINTQGLDEELDSVFYVQRAGDGKYVTFATMTDEGIQGEIIFSLLDGSVAGMTIDCGSW